jgi:uncharacterized protein (DUF1501 family)
LDSLPTSTLHIDTAHGNASNLKQQAKITAAALSTGLTATANLKLTGFDSHSNNDSTQFNLLSELIHGVDYLVKALDYFGIAGKTTIVIASDVGRTPTYNSSAGKDHSTNGGMIVLHPKGSNRGGKVFGKTNALGAGVAIDLNTGLANEHGTRLNVRHMMLGLRDHLGLTAKADEKKFTFDSNMIVPSVFS